MKDLMNPFLAKIEKEIKTDFNFKFVPIYSKVIVSCCKNTLPFTANACLLANSTVQKKIPKLKLKRGMEGKCNELLIQ